jgi:hypothetical protein
MDIQIGEGFGVFNQEVKDNYLGNPVEISLKNMNPIQSDASSTPILSIISELAKEEARLLEVLSTIVYLKNAGYDNEKLKLNLERLKGHLEVFFNHAFDLNKKYSF